MSLHVCTLGFASWSCAAAVARVGAAIATALLVTSCSSATRLSGGPAIGYVRGEDPAYGGEALGRLALGQGGRKGFLAVETAARAFATEQSQVLGLGLGPAWFGTYGPGLVTVDATAMLGAERFDNRLLGLGTLRAGVGGGVVLDGSTHYRLSPWGEEMPGRTNIEEKTALTLELTGNMDLPFTRERQYSLGLLVGIAWLLQEEYVSGRQYPPVPHEIAPTPIELPTTK